MSHKKAQISNLNKDSQDLYGGKFNTLLPLLLERFMYIIMELLNRVILVFMVIMYLISTYRRCERGGML